MVKKVFLLLSLISTVSLAQTLATGKKASKKATPNLSVTSLPLAKKGPSLQLSPKDAADLILSQGIKTREVNYNYQVLTLKPYEALSAYDWKVSLESGFEKDRTESFSVYGNDPNIERRKTTFGLTKSFLTGTALSFDYVRTSQKYISPSSQIPITLDTATITLEQALLGNFFGIADRATVNSAEVEYQANTVLRVNELQNLVLDTLRQFWNTYVAEENFKESLASKERYEKLVEAVKRKNSVGYSSPGEFTQIQAEYETRIQTVKIASVDYLKNLDQLQTLLGIAPGTEINFVIPTELPPAPKLKDLALEDRRTLVSQRLKVESAKEALRAAKFKKLPTLNLVGKLGDSGLDDDASLALNQINSGAHPKYYVGLKFQYNFGSDLQSQTEFNRRATFELEQARLDRQRLEEKDKQTQAERKVTSTFAVAQSKKLQKEYREKAIQELTRSYNQGRTDIAILIDAMNKYFSSEVEYVRSIGDYQIALNEWAAARDELIPNKETP